MADTQVKAAKLLLDRGIRITIPDAPFWDRIRRRNKIYIKPLRAGTIVELAILMLDNDLAETLTNKELNTRLDLVARAVAIAMLNDKELIEKNSEALADRLLWKYPARVLIKIYRYIESLNEIKDFMSITDYFHRQARMMMTKRTGQARKGS